MLILDPQHWKWRKNQLKILIIEFYNVLMKLCFRFLIFFQMKTLMETRSLTRKKPLSAWDGSGSFREEIGLFDASTQPRLTPTMIRFPRQIQVISFGKSSFFEFVVCPCSWFFIRISILIRILSAHDRPSWKNSEFFSLCTVGRYRTVLYGR
jgi:hypothetical protein